MSLSIIQRVDREISYGPLAPDHYLSGLRLTGIVDLSHDLEAVELVLTYASEGEGKGSGIPEQFSIYSAGRKQ